MTILSTDLVFIPKLYDSVYNTISIDFNRIKDKMNINTYKLSEIDKNTLLELNKTCEILLMDMFNRPNMRYKNFNRIYNMYIELNKMLKFDIENVNDILRYFKIFLFINIFKRYNDWDNFKDNIIFSDISEINTLDSNLLLLILKSLCLLTELNNIGFNNFIEKINKNYSLKCKEREYLIKNRYYYIISDIHGYYYILSAIKLFSEYKKSNNDNSILESIYRLLNLAKSAFEFSGNLENGFFANILICYFKQEEKSHENEQNNK